jgi:signal transduction histidine kinase
MKLQTKFTLYLTLTFIVMMVVIFSLAYMRAREEAKDHAYEICDRLLAEVESTRAYVREVLRPVMFDLAGDRFIPEAMSTSYVARRQTEIFLKKYPDYFIKFASLNPRNPINLANDLEKDIIEYFKSNPGVDKWRGVNERNGVEYLTVATPYRFTEDCLRCHGVPADAPPELIERYGDKNGFGVKVGDVTINSIGVPIKVTYLQVWRKFLHGLLPVIVLLGVTFIITTSLFSRLVTHPVKTLRKGVESIAEGSYGIRVKPAGSKEINDLADAYNKMAETLENNIAERNRAEDDRERINKELEQIIYVTSHDLRAPLVNVEGYYREIKYSLDELGKVLGDMSVPPAVREKALKIMEKDIPESTGYIEKSIYKMDSLLNALLRLSRSGNAELKLGELDMNLLMRNVIDTLKFRIKEYGAIVNIAELPACRGDEAQINQLFSNLIWNAVKYLAPERPGVINVSGFRKNGESIYCVEDNGIGIKHEDHEAIFKPFHQIKPEGDGEGLGLSIARKIAERHKGKIWVESEHGKGSRFFVALPG